MYPFWLRKLLFSPFFAGAARRILFCCTPCLESFLFFPFFAREGRRFVLSFLRSFLLRKSGEKPKRIMSGARKSPITPREIRACTNAKPSANLYATCDPRRSGFRGEKSFNAGQDLSNLLMNISERVLDASLTSFISILVHISSAASRATIDMIGGVPTCMRSTPFAGT